MDKLAIRLIFMGEFPAELHIKGFKKWDSQLFQIKDIQEYPLNLDPDWDDWAYSDALLESNLPSFATSNNTISRTPTEKIDINIYVLNKPIQDNYYSRIINNNRVVLTYYQVVELLKKNMIPLDNFLIYHIYLYALVYLIKKGKEMTMEDEKYLLHKDCRGCLFDYSIYKNEVIFKCRWLEICGECKYKLITRGVSPIIIESIPAEFRQRTKPCYEKIILLLKKHPIISFGLSFIIAILTSVIASCIYGCFIQSNRSCCNM